MRTTIGWIGLLAATEEESSLTVVEGPQATTAPPPPGGVCAADIFACWDLVRHPTNAVARSFHPQYCNHVPTDCPADINSCSRMSFLALESNSWQVRLCTLLCTRKNPVRFKIRPRNLVLYFLLIVLCSTERCKRVVRLLIFIQ